MGYLETLYTEIKVGNFTPTKEVIGLLYSYANKKYAKDEDSSQVFVSTFCELLGKKEILSASDVSAIFNRSKGHVVDSLRKIKTSFWVCNSCGHRKRRVQGEACLKCGSFNWSFESIETGFSNFETPSGPKSTLDEMYPSEKKRSDWYEVFYKAFSKNVLACEDLPKETALDIIKAVETGTPIRWDVKRKEALEILGKKRNRLYLKKKFFRISRKIMDETLLEMKDIIP